MKRLLACACSCLAVACTRDLQLPPLPGPGTLYGRVVVAVAGQETPAPAAGASISLLGSSASTTSGPDGSFFIGGVVQTSGSLLFQVGPDGGGGYSHQTLVSLSEVGAGPGRQISLGDVLVGSNAQIRGRVLLGDKIGQPGGQGGTTVFVPVAPYTTITNDDGTFTLANLPSGTIQLSMFHPAYQASSIGTVQLGAGQEYQVADVILTPQPGTQLPGTVSGSVTFQPDLSSAAGTTVSASPLAGASTQAQVNDDGTFSIANLPPNIYSVQVSHPNYTPAAVLNVLVQSAELIVIPEIVLTTSPPIDAGEGSGDGGGRQPGSPLANAGPPGAVRLGFAYTLDATGSSDPSNETLTYSWTQTAGAPVSLSINNSILASRPTFEAPLTPDTLAFTVTVTNTSGLSSSASTTVAVVPAPVAQVTPSTVTLRAGESATLDGSQSFDPTGSLLQYAWSQPVGNLTLSGTTGPKISVTASASGVSTVELVVTNGFVSSDPFDVTVTTGVAPTVTVNAGFGQTIGTGVGVILSGSATSTDPNDSFIYQWAQTSGAPVTLLNSSSATASFQAPAQAGLLQFSLTASSDTAGIGSATTAVDVVDLTPPVIVSMTPSVDGGVGPWLYATATFSKALDPASVTAANVFISAGDAGTPIPAALTYDAATFTVKVLPNAPLITGAPYRFTVGAVTDDTPAHNVHAPAVSVQYVAATPQWQFWSSELSFQAGNNVPSPSPGIAVTAREVDVFGRRWEGSCSGGTWIMNPGPDGGLVDQPLCVTFGNTGYPIGRVGVVAAGVPYGSMIGGCGSCGPGDFFEEQGDGGWLELAASPPTMFSDGTSLLGPAAGYNGYFAFYTYNPACPGSWCGETIDPTTGVYDPNNMGGAAIPGAVVASAWRAFNGNVYYLVAYERGAPGTSWVELDGGQSFGGVDWSSGESPTRFAFARGEPFGVYQANNPTSQIIAAAWSPTTASWTLYPVANGNVGNFDVFARGDTAWIAFVAGQQLYLDRIDLSSSSPALVPVPGPNGLSLNNGVTCPPGHPELFVSDDSVWITWHEACSPGVWQVFLRQMF
jgi:hypothetical protein